MFDERLDYGEDMITNMNRGKSALKRGRYGHHKGGEDGHHGGGR